MPRPFGKFSRFWHRLFNIHPTCFGVGPFFTSQCLTCKWNDLCSIDCFERVLARRGEKLEPYFQAFKRKAQKKFLEDEKRDMNEES